MKVLKANQHLPMCYMIYLLERHFTIDYSIL